MKTLAPLLLISALFILCSGSVNANVYFVDNIKGLNKNSGSAKSPWKTINNSIRKLSKGDSLVLIDNGKKLPYRETLNIRKLIDITIKSLSATSKSIIVGSDDWSSSEKYEWVAKEGLWLFRTRDIPEELFVASSKMWNVYGIDSLQKKQKAKSKKHIDPGEWLYDKKFKQVVYKPKNNEKLNELHIEAVVRSNNIKITEASNITVDGLRLQFSKRTSLFISRQSSEILINDVDVFDSGHAAIKVIEGGYDIQILGCTIDNTGNNGILFKGYKSRHVSNTIISGCKITNVHANDCITYHKDKHYDDVGTNHVIKNNIVGKCGEQGIDITSGSGFVLTDNTTYENGISGIVVGHGANNVKIKGHLSINDGRRAGILVKRSSNVEMVGSIVIGKGPLVDIDRNEGFVSRNNKFINISESNSASIRIGEKTKNYLFDNNEIITTNADNTVPLVLVKKAGFAGQFNNNTWWSRQGLKTVIYRNKNPSKYINVFQHNNIEAPVYYKDINVLNDLVSTESFDEIRNVLR